MEPAVATITHAPIDTSALLRDVERADVGALALFVGVVRAERSEDGIELVGLDYSAYEPMARAELARAVTEVTSTHAISAARAVHRLGRLRIGEASVAVAVSAPHRAAAFAACREIIERVKADVPIFKRELWANGTTTWVDGIDGGETHA